MKPPDNLIEGSMPVFKSRLDEKIVTLTTDDAYLPYEFVQDGKIKGIAVDIVTEAFQRMGYKVVINVAPWPRVIEVGKDGDTDALFSLFYTKERAEYLLYSQEPLGKEANYLYSLSTSSFNYDGTMSSIKGAKIGTQKGYFNGDLFESAAEEGVITKSDVDSPLINLRKLLSNRIDIFVSSQYTARYLIEHEGVEGKIREMQVPIMAEENFYLCFPKDRKASANLSELFDKTLREMKKDGSVDSIIQNYVKHYQ